MTDFWSQFEKVPKNSDGFWSQFEKIPSQKETKQDIYKQIEQDFPREKYLDNTIGLLKAVDNGKYFGLGSKLGGVVHSAGTAPVDYLLGAGEAVGQAVANIKNKGIANAFDDIDVKIPTRKERYNEIVETANEAHKKFAEEHPIINAATTITAAVRNPVNRATSAYISEGAQTLEGSGNAVKALNYLNKAEGNLPKFLRGSTVGQADAVANSLAFSDDLSDFKDNLKQNSKVNAVISAVSPVAGYTVGKFSDKIGDVGEKLGEVVEKSWFAPVFGRTEKEIKKLIAKYSEGGWGSIENIGTSAKRIADEGVKKIEHYSSRLYNKALSLTNPKAPAVTNRAVREIDNLSTELDKQSRNYLAGIKSELEEGLNARQLDSIKMRIGKDVDTGKLGLTPNQQSRLYDSIKGDYYESLARAAKNGDEKAVINALTKADNFYSEMMQPRSEFNLLKQMANARTAESTVGNQVMKILTSKGGDVKKLNSLAKNSENKQLLKNEIIPLIDTKEKFNKLSPIGKEFVYGEALPEFDKLFNQSVNDKFVNKANELANYLYGKGGSDTVPYLSSILDYFYTK